MCVWSSEVGAQFGISKSTAAPFMQHQKYKSLNLWLWIFMIVLGGMQSYSSSQLHKLPQLSPQQHCATPPRPMLPVAAGRGGMLIS